MRHLLTFVQLYSQTQSFQIYENYQLLHFEKQLIPNTSTLRDKQNEWSLHGFLTTGSKVKTFLVFVFLVGQEISIAPGTYQTGEYCFTRALFDNKCRSIYGYSTQDPTVSRVYSHWVDIQ